MPFSALSSLPNVHLINRDVPTSTAMANSPCVCPTVAPPDEEAALGLEHRARQVSS